MPTTTTPIAPTAAPTSASASAPAPAPAPVPLIAIDIQNGMLAIGESITGNINFLLNTIAALTARVAKLEQTIANLDWTD